MSGNIFFTADLHLGHRKIIDLNNRPFTSIEDHDQVLIDNWNGLVRSRADIVYVLGDIALAPKKRVLELLYALNGRIVLVRGNHDFHNIKGTEVVKRFEFIKDLYETKIEGQKIVMCHYPLESWRGSNDGSYMIHGHCHGRLPSRGLRVDVGVDINDYRPVSWEQIKTHFAFKADLFSRDGIKADRDPILWTYHNKILELQDKLGKMSQQLMGTEDA